MYAIRFIILVAVMAGIASAVNGQDVGSCALGQAAATLDVNNVRAKLYNNGNLFWNGGDNIYTVPKDSGVQAIFTAGIWIGGLDNDGDLRFAGTQYGPFEYWPGPLDETGNPPNDCGDYDRIYKVNRTDLESLDNGGDPTVDIIDWPYNLGAPVIDGDGIPDNYDLSAGDSPDIIGDQMAWWVMNETGNVKEWSFTEPIGLEVQVSAFAFNDSTSALYNTTFYTYHIVHKGDETLINTYIGFWVDADLGYQGDDFMGSDSTLGMGIVYNGVNNDGSTADDPELPEHYGAMPPALGIDFVRGPESHTGLSKMTTFIDPSIDSSVHWWYGNSDDPYQFLRGIWRDGIPMTFGGTGYGGTIPTSFMFPGNAAKREYWSEENTDGILSRNEPGDRLFLMSSGPFDLHPGDEQEIVIAIIWSRAGNRLASYAKLLEDDVFIQGFFDNGFQEMDIIDAPVVAAIPGDQSATLTWDNPASSNNIDDSYSTPSRFLYDSFADDSLYRFEGYDVYLFENEIDSVGERIATYDIPNNIAVVVDEWFDHDENGYIKRVTAEGSNAGVQHGHEASNLINYRDYHFGVQAYAYNQNSLPKVIRSEVARIMVTPGEQLAEDLTREQRLERIGIVPNPYKSSSLYEPDSESRAVRFTGLPREASIKIFTLAGSLVRTIEKDDASPFFEWDLSTDEGRVLGGGLYLVHIESPELGEKVLKFGHVGRE